MSGESVNIATAGTSRSRPHTNSALANGAENQFICRKVVVQCGGFRIPTTKES